MPPSRVESARAGALLRANSYRSLAEADAGYPLIGERVRSLVVAYETDYRRAVDLADRYDVALTSVNPERVLTLAG